MSTTAKNVMMIDDDTINNIIMTGIVKNMQEIGALQIFTNAWEAIEHLDQAAREDFPHVILIDLKMPEMDGFEFIEYFEKKFGIATGTSLYIVSSSVSSRDREKSRLYTSVSDFIIKPLTREKIAAILTEKI